MRVGLVTPRYPPNVVGGGEISAKLLAEQLATDERIDSVLVFCFDGETTEIRNGVEIRRFTSLSPTITEWQNIRAFPHLYRVIDEVDLFHAYNMELNPVVGVLGNRYSVPAVATLNSYHFFKKAAYNSSPTPIERFYEIIGYPTTGRVLRRFMKQLDAYIAISTAVKRVYSEHEFNADDIEVVPNMIDPSFSVPEGTSDEMFRILYVGDLSEKKGVDHLLRAMTQLPEENHLHIVGDGPKRAPLESLARSLGISDRVTFTGRIPYEQIPEQYANSDLFVHPGIWPEPFGRTVLEAMQAGLPVVCTDIGGPADLVRDPELRCPPGDSNALADAIKTARQRHTEIGKRNCRYVNDEFTPGSVTTQIVDLYQRLIV